MAVKILNGIDVDGSMNIVASDVPNLDASKITSGTFSADRIPNLSGVYQPAGEYLTLETAETTFQPLGNYLTSVPAEYLTQTEGDARYLQTYDGLQSSHVTGALGYTPYQEGTPLSASSLVLSNIEKSNVVLDGEFGWDANDSAAPASLGTYGGSYPDGVYFAGNSTTYTIYHTGHFSGTNIANWQTAYGWGNHASVGYLTSLPSHNHDTLYDALGSADAVNVRIDEEVFPAIPTNNNQLTNGAGYITSVPAEYLTQTEGDARYLRLSGGTLTGNLTAPSFIGRLQGGLNGAPDATIWCVSGEYTDWGIFYDEGNPDKIHFKSSGVSKANIALDTGVITTTQGNSSQWSTAYGWGNHASAGYLTSIPSSYATDAEVSSAVGAIESSINERIDTEVFDAIATVDGNIPTNNNQLTNGAGYITSADGGNAQTLDGINSTGFVRQLGDTNNPNYQTPSSRRVDPNANNPTNHHYAITTFGNGGNVTGQLATHYQTGRLYSRGYNSSWSAWNAYATESYVNTAVSNLVASAPGALNTLNELAAALGDDANFSTTITNQIAAVDERINTEVFDAIATVDGNIPTNNNQLTNGAGYLTSLPNNAATFTNNIYLSNSATTANFITELTNLGAFQDNYKAFKVAWSYAGNSNLDVGFESVELAGCLIECWGGTYKHVRLTRPTTGTGGRSIYVYNDQGSSYSPGWRQIWTSDEFSSTNISNWNTAYGWGNHASAGYLTSIPSSYATDAEVATAASNAEGNAVAYTDTRIEEEVFPAIPINNNQLTNGAGYITAVPSSFSANSITIGGGATLTESTDRADLLMIKSSTSSWGGLQVSNTSNEGIISLMINGNEGGLYDDQNGEWILKSTENGGLTLGYDNATKLTTTSAGITISGEIVTTGGNSTNWNTAYGWGNHASAGYLKSIPATYVQQTQDIVSGNIHPVGDREQLLGLDSNRWQVVFCEILDSAGQHEKNLQNPKGEKSVGEYETGTVLVWKDGKNIPCTEPADHMRMGIAVQGVASPLIQGAEPVLVTGTVNEGDYLVTSSVEGHAKAISPQFMRQHGLYDCVLGKALENGEGESYLLKTWINI